MRRTLSRRNFIRLAASAAAAAAGGPAARVLASNRGGRGVTGEIDETISYNELYDNPPMLGRVEATWLAIWSDPRIPASREATIFYDDVIPIYRAVRTEGYWSSPQNDIWYETDIGWIHSSHVVPCREVFQEPEDRIGGGFWGEIVVPTSWHHWRPGLNSLRYFDLAYGTVYWVRDRVDDEDGIAWYEIEDDLNPKARWFIQAHHVRRIDPSEFAPISPDVEDKNIVIDLSAQMLTCYENGIQVFQSRIASGTNFTDDEGNTHFFETAPGDYHIERKRPSRRMMGGAEADDFYDLPGVPWVSYFTKKGAAIHGTYWHNDYGKPRSHGCINVTSDASKWIYRWVTPYTPYEETYYWTQPEDTATPITIVG